MKEGYGASNLGGLCGKRMVDKCLPSSLYLTMLVIIYWALDLSQGHLQGGGSQRGGRLDPYWDCSNVPG
jgi:hypothetical protein